MGSGTISVELGGDEKEVSKCINCEGGGSLTCTTCQGSGIQPRYLDRRYIHSGLYNWVMGIIICQYEWKWMLRHSLKSFQFCFSSMFITLLKCPQQGDQRPEYYCLKDSVFCFQQGIQR